MSAAASGTQQLGLGWVAKQAYLMRACAHTPTHAHTHTYTHTCRTIIPNLVEKFTDSKILVRTANLKVLKKLMAAVPPQQVLDLLASGMSHSSWRVREEVVNTTIMVRGIALLHAAQWASHPGAM